jgi:phosphinothricin acetyltransferase
VALHERLGFQKIAHFKEVGWKFNQWIDVGYWEFILQNPEENASPVAAEPRR